MGRTEPFEESNGNGEALSPLSLRDHGCQHYVQAGRTEAEGIFGLQLGQQPRQWEVYVIPHHDDVNDAARLQIVTSKFDCHACDGDRAGGCRVGNEEGDIFQRHEDGAGMRIWVQPCAAVNTP